MTRGRAHARQGRGDDTPQLRPPPEFGRLLQRLLGNRLRAAVQQIEVQPRDDDCRAEAAEEPLW